MERLIFPLYLLPPTNMIQMMLNQKELVIGLGEPFKKQTFRSRFEIMSPNKRHVLSIPMKKGKTNQLMSRAEISYDEDWQRKHWQALCTAYDTSPFFEFLKDDLNDIFMLRPILLKDYSLDLLKWVLEVLKYKGSIRVCQELPYSYEFDEHAIQPYDQVFMEKLGYMPNLSILDFLFNVGV